MWRGGERTLVQCHTSQFFALSGAALCAFGEPKKDFPPMYASISRWKIFFGSLDTGQAGLECQPVVCCYLVQYHRCVIHVCELCDGGIVLVTRASY